MKLPQLASEETVLRARSTRRVFAQDRHSEGSGRCASLEQDLRELRARRDASGVAGGALYAGGMTLALGIDLGGTKIEIIGLDENGGVLLRRRRPSPRGSY